MADPSARALSVHVGEDLVALADDLAAHLAASHHDVLARDLIVVPTPGIGQWLGGRLSSRLGASMLGDGVFAGTELLLWSRFLARLLEPLGADGSCWTVGAMSLRSLGILTAADAEVRDLVPHEAGARLHPVARRCADLFDQLFRWRPDVADEWMKGSSEDPRAALLRALASRAPSPPPHELVRGAARALRDGAVASTLPACVHLFGGDGIAGGPSAIELLDALASQCDVVIHLVTPSLPRFERLRASTPFFAGAPPTRGTRADDTDEDLLMRSWGASTADTARLVAQLPDRARTSIDTVATSDDSAAATLLGAMRQALRGGHRAPVASDASVSFHACVGPLRQVEAARDAILHAMKDDPSLGPLDAAILCPDLPRFAPYVDAVFGEGGGAPALPYVLRDRSLARAVPMVAALDVAMRLLVGRVTRSAVADLLASPFVQRRFGLGAEALDVLERWTIEANVKWGVNVEDRIAEGLPTSFEDGTWRRAIDRLLLGTALPSDEVTGLGLRPVALGHDLEPLGALCRLIETIESLRADATVPRTVGEWCTFCEDVADRLLRAGLDDTTSSVRLSRLLEQLRADGAGVDDDIEFAEFQGVLADRAAAAHELVASGGGGVTVTSFAPLRNVPFRVVVLLGLDDQSLGRASASDAAFGAPRVGDRDPRQELRASLLASVLSCADRLVVTYDGADLTTNEPLAPSTVVAELLELVDRVCVDGLDAVRFVHPRHAHGEGDLDAGGAGPFSFDAGALARALELRCVAAGPRVRVGGVEPAAPPARLARDDLAAFLRGPQRRFLAEALGVRLPWRDHDGGDELPTRFDQLERWRLVEQLTARALDADVEPGDPRFEELCRAVLDEPDTALSLLPRRYAEVEVLDRGGARDKAAELLHAIVRQRGDGDPAFHDAEATVLGTVVGGSAQVFDGRKVVRWTASVNGARARLEAVVDLLVLTAWRPEVPWSAVAIHRAPSDKAVQPEKIWVPGDGPEDRARRAEHALARLVGIHRLGSCEALPLFFKTTMALGEALRGAEPPTRDALVELAATEWERDFSDRTDAFVRYCFDGSFEELLAIPVEDRDPVVDERAGGSRLLAYSLALCEGLLSLPAGDLEAVPQ